MRISPVILASFSYGPSLQEGVSAGRGGGRRDILVPLINCVIMNQGGFHLDATHEPMVLICTIIDIELDRGFFRCYVAGGEGQGKIRHRRDMGPVRSQLTRIPRASRQGFGQTYAPITHSRVFWRPTHPESKGKIWPSWMKNLTPETGDE